MKKAEKKLWFFVCTITLLLFCTTVSCKGVLKQIKIQSLSHSGDDGITVVWKSIAGADGYKLYMSEKEKAGFKRIAAGNSNLLKYKKTKLKKGKRYYFKVRYYTKKGGKKVYSAYSKVCSLKAGRTTSEKLLDKIKGNYQAESNGLEGSDRYAGYFHLYMTRKKFSIFDSEAGNPGFSGKIAKITKSYLTVKVNTKDAEEYPGKWRPDSKGSLKLKYKKTGKTLKLTNRKSTLVLTKQP